MDYHRILEKILKQDDNIDDVYITIKENKYKLDKKAIVISFALNIILVLEINYYLNI